MAARDVVDRSFEVVNGWRGARTGRPEPEISKFIATMRAATTEDLIQAVSTLTSDEHDRAANIKAVREAIISEIEYRNARHISDTMRHLDRAATRLTIVSVILAVVGVLVGVVQIWIALK